MANKDHLDHETSRWEAYNDENGTTTTTSSGHPYHIHARIPDISVISQRRAEILGYVQAACGAIECTVLYLGAFGKPDLWWVLAATPVPTVLARSPAGTGSNSFLEV